MDAANKAIHARLMIAESSNRLTPHGHHISIGTCSTGIIRRLSAITNYRALGWQLIKLIRCIGCCRMLQVLRQAEVVGSARKWEPLFWRCPRHPPEAESRSKLRVKRSIYPSAPVPLGGRDTAPPRDQSQSRRRRRGPGCFVLIERRLLHFARKKCHRVGTSC